MKWEPIETAPRDGTGVLVWIPHTRRFSIHAFNEFNDRWEEFGWTTPQPTQWQKLPEPPK